MKKIFSIFVMGVIILGGFISISKPGNANRVEILEESFHFSKPIINDIGDFLIVDFEESDGFLKEPFKPLLPVITKVFTFPLGTKILDVGVNYTNEKYELSKKICPCPTPFILSGFNKLKESDFKIDDITYSSDSFYPGDNYFIHKGAGLYGDEHVLYLTVKVVPQYNPIENIILIPDVVNIQIYNLPPEKPLFTADDFDLVIISPEKFVDSLQPLVDHKNNVSVKTILKTTGEIYNEYSGKDKAEKIKYFIKDMVEKFGSNYILLVGNIKSVPMRKCANTVITGVINWYEILSDLYYADIYDFNGNFSSWDTNNNDKYCEYRYNNCNGKIIDDVDLYPDVGVGRLPCDTLEECNNIVDKIIKYETSTNADEWFNKIILMGGDTSPNFESAFEGEWLHENYIGPGMNNHGFDLIKLYTSLDTFQPEIITDEINSGAGFVSYAGHGYMDSIGTYPPVGNSTISYSIKNINDLDNENMLPIFFLDACLTGKIDYDIFDKIMIPICVLYPYTFIHFIKRILDKIETNRFFPCFAGSLLNKKSGGGIAVIAATQPGFFGIAYDNEEIIDIIFGSSKLNRFFFESYEQGISLSTMFIEAQNKYINAIRSPESMVIDYVTINEFNLFGDPSLKIGGYSIN